MQRILNIILNILVGISVIIVLIVLYSNIEINILKKDYFNFCGYTAFTVKTASMATAIDIDDVVIVKLGSDDLKQGDIISFKQDENIITHRIIEISDNKIITKGDSNNAQDEPINKDKVIGKVINIIHNLGIWKKVLKTKEVLISITITIILFIISFSIKVKGEKNDKKE